MLKGDLLKNIKVGIDAVDISAIMGINKSKSAYNLYLEKIALIEESKKSEDIPDHESSEATYWDCNAKETLSREFSIRSEKKVRKENKKLIDEEYDFIIGNIDRKIVGENAILICKTENVFLPREWNGGELPASYLLECQHYMRISKADKSYIASLIGGKKFVYKEVLRDEEVINMIIQIEKDFWFNNVIKRIPPKSN